jgi:hypothetical protein
MKLTKSKLKQIIKEELNQSLNEISPEGVTEWPALEITPTKHQEPEPGAIEQRIRKLESLVAQLLSKIPKGPPINPEDFTPFGEGKQ